MQLPISVSMIACVAKNNVIGNNGDLVFHIKDDMNYFVRMTKPGVVIMGRKTFESLKDKDGNPRPLPGRINIVVTRQENYKVPEGVVVCNKLMQAVDIAKGYAMINTLPSVYIIGGQELYEAGMLLADLLVLTEVDADAEGDTYFPKVNKNIWHEFTRTSAQDDETGLKYHHVMYRRDF